MFEWFRLWIVKRIFKRDPEFKQRLKEIIEQVNLVPPRLKKLYVIFHLPEGGQTVTEVKLKNRFVERYIDDYKMLTVEIVKPNYMSVFEWARMKNRKV